MTTALVSHDREGACHGSTGNPHHPDGLGPGWGEWQRHAERARMILAAAAGQRTQAIA